LFGGEFNAALVAPSNSRNDETWLPEWSAGLTVHEILDEHIAKKLVGTDTTFDCRCRFSYLDMLRQISAAIRQKERGIAHHDPAKV
jgi:hypothetical protein